MATPFTPVPLGQAGTGAAFVLRNDNTALNILRQGEAARARAAALAEAQRQKQAEAIGKLYEEDRKINYDGGGLFQESFNAEAANAPTQLADLHRKYAAGQLNYQDFRAQVGDFKGGLDRNRLLGIDYDKQMNTYMGREETNAYRDRNGLRSALGQTVLVDDGTGKTRRVKATEYDVIKAQEAIDNNPMTYEPEKIIEGFTKNRAASTMAEAQAGRIGGVHTSSSVTSNGFELQKGADGAWSVKTASNGLPIINYGEEDLARDRGSKPFDMAIKRLRIDYEKQQAEALKAGQKLPDKTDLDLYKDKARKFYFFRESQGEGRNAQPAQNPASKVFVLPANNQVESGIVGSGAIDTGRRTPDGKTVYQKSVAWMPAIGTAPTYTKGTDPTPRAFEKDGAVLTQITWEDRDGVLRYDGRNTTPLNVKYGRPMAVLINPATGRELFPPDEVQSEADWIRWAQKARNTPKYAKYTGVGTTVEVVARKNNTYSGSRDEVFKQLKAEEAQKSASQRKYTPKSDERLRDMADRLTANDAQTGYASYYGPQKAAIDRDTKGQYQKDAAYWAKLQRLRQAVKAPAAAPAKKPVPGFTPTPATKPTTQPIKKAGSKKSGTSWD